MAHELLGEVLINCHNQKSIVELFEIARNKIVDGSFEDWRASLLL